MTRLSDMPNIGKELEEQIMKAGVETPGQLIDLGSKEVFLRIRAFDDSACINRLYALEGAIRNVRWHYLPQDIKEELKAFYSSLQPIK
jgi:DNA transformation protein